MMRRFPSHRLFEFGKLPDVDLTLLEQFAESVRRYPRRTVIRREGDAPDAIYLLQEGWVVSMQSSQRGRRHIAKIHLPGDILGAASVCLTEAADTLLSVTAVSFRKLAIKHFADLFARSPTFASRMFLSAQRERVILMDRLLSAATMPAPGTLAAFLLELRDRLQLIGLAQGSTFGLPLTQLQIGEFLGISPIQVNRAIKELERQGLIERHSHGITLIDTEQLEYMSQRRTRVLNVEAGDQFSGVQP